MADNTTLRQADNKVNIVGWLKKMELEYADNNDTIRGSVTIMVDKNSDHIVNTYVKRLTNDKKENKAFKGLETFMSTAVSIAQLLLENKTEEEALAGCTGVSISNGQLRLREFFDQQENFVCRPDLSSNFFNRLGSSEVTDPHATFDVECVIQSVKHEFKSEDETGRLIVDVLVPAYAGGIMPFTFVIPEGMADEFESTFPVKSTCELWGNIVNTVEVTVTHKQGFGEAKTEESRTFTNELVVTGGMPPYDEENPRAYSPEIIQKALATRENEYKPQLLEKQKENAAKRNANSSGGNTAHSSGFNRPGAAAAAPVTGFNI